MLITEFELLVKEGDNMWLLLGAVISNIRNKSLIKSIVNLFYSLPVKDLLFILPQLCQIIKVYPEVYSLQRLLFDLSRTDFNVAQIVRSIFLAAVADAIPETVDISKRMLDIVNDVAVGGNKNLDLNLNLETYKSNFANNVESIAEFIDFEKLKGIKNGIFEGYENDAHQDRKLYKMADTVLDFIEYDFSVEAYLDNLTELFDSDGKDIDEVHENANYDYESSFLSDEISDLYFKKKYFEDKIGFIMKLDKISDDIVAMALPEKSEKNRVLKEKLQEINKAIPSGVFFGPFDLQFDTFKILNIPTEDCFTLNSRDRVPYMLRVEVIPSNQEEIEIGEDFIEDVTSESVDSIDDWEIVDDINAGSKVLEKVFGNTWSKKIERLRRKSTKGSTPGWNVISFIIKTGDDLRQEQLAMQLIQTIDKIFKKDNLPLWVKPYLVLPTTHDSGIIETVHDALSIHGIKEDTHVESLSKYFQQAYTKPEDYRNAQIAFIESLAGYSLICYFLQLKDRHNGNILIDRHGHLIHIDYGFLLSSSPGNMQFESAPFKLPMEFCQVMGGPESDLFTYFRTLVEMGFMSIRRSFKEIMMQVEIMLPYTNMLCFKDRERTIINLKDRFKLSLKEHEITQFIDTMVNDSLNNWTTETYDRFQYYTNGIL